MKSLRAIADALVASLLVVATEAVVIGFLHRRELVGAWEMKQGVRLLMPIGWAIAMPIAFVGAVLLALVRRVPERRGARLGVAAVAALAGGAVALGVSTGRHFASWAVRAPFVAAVAAVSALAVHALAPRVAKVERRSSLAFGGGAAVAIAVAMIADVVVLPRLYPAFHVALAATALALSPAIASVWADEPKGRASRPERAYVAIVVAAAALTVAFVPALAHSLERADNVRFLYGEHAPTLRYAVEVVSAIAPVAPTEDVELPSEATSTAAPSIDLRGRDILVISVDALRADHAGAYGYPRPTTPNIDALAREGVRFEHAYCATPHTSYSVTSMLTGKYMRPLLLQGAGADSDTLARLLRTYGYRTAAFYPPAVFFIDADRFVSFRDSGLDFEYRRVEFLAADERASQIETYLGRVKPDRRVLLWVHLFEPHEPYEKHPDHDFGDRDVDRYDGEIAAADAGIGKIVAAVRARRPDTVVVVTSDHGEEFGEHGGRYHGTTVFEEQVRVPLVVVAPGILAPHVVASPVQTIDLLPTILAGLRIPRPARVRGNDLGPLLAGRDAASFAFAETDEQTLLADGNFRLVCARRLGACQLYDVAADPGERHDVSAKELARFGELRKRLREIEASHGKYELAGLRAEGRAWPDAIRRGMAGDADAALDVAALLDDADVSFRRKAAEVLFELARRETAEPLRLALVRDDDDIVRRFAALALTRMGEGAGRTLELVEDKDVFWRRLAALALAEAGDGRGVDTLVGWWQAGDLPFERARQIAAALAKVRAKKAAVPLSRSLGDVRLRPYLADALAAIGEEAVRPPLLQAFAVERYAPAREAIARALVTLGAKAEIAPPLVRFLGVPDPLPDGVGLAKKAGFLPSIGGPDDDDLAKLRRGRGVARVHVIVPRGGRGDGALRLVVRGRSRGTSPVSVRVGAPLDHGARHDDLAATELDPAASVEVALPPSDSPVEIPVDVPASIGGKPGSSALLAVDRPDSAELDALAVVPLADELPPPPPEPWTPSASDRSDDVVDDGK